MMDEGLNTDMHCQVRPIYLALFKEQREAKQGEGWRRLATVGEAKRRFVNKSETNGRIQD